MKNIKILLVVALGVGGIFLLSRLPGRTPALPVLADRVIQKCARAEVKSVCYETEIPKLMKIISMEEAFTVTLMVQQKDNDFPYCHVLGHKLASIETKKDPSKWKDVIARCPSGVCSNGCVHGAFQEKYRDSVLSGTSFNEAKAEFMNLCEKSSSFTPTGLEQGSCYHALGHLLMYITGGNINRSVATCDEVAKKPDGRDFTNVCYDGAFMQIFQPLDVDDKSLIKNINVNKENVWDFCKQFSGQKLNQCWQESWPLFLKEIGTSKGLLDYCSKLGPAMSQCINNTLYLMPIQFRFNFTAINKYCSELPAPYQNMCYGMTASRLLEIDKTNIEKVINYCSGLPVGNKEACFDQVVNDSAFDFNPGSPEFNKLCSDLPEPWKEKCAAKGK